MGAKDEGKKFVTSILDGSAMVDDMNVIGFGLFFEKMGLNEFLC